jgi:endonuclease/exonuclease/phosphatase family metal-dependent hydrolase
MTIFERPRGRRLLASAETVVRLALIAFGGAWVIFVFQPFGHRTWTFGAAALLGGIVCMSRRPRLTDMPSPDGRAARRRGFGLSRTAILGGLSGWMGLIGWSALSPGGPMPPPKDDPASVRVLTWNILLGDEGGPPWSRHDWPVRKPALRAALGAAAPDILCVQEALAGQVTFLEGELLHHRRVGVGRDDGRSGGEHCAIYFDARRFEPLGGGTFWLEGPADEPPSGPALGPRRICTWVRLHDRAGGRVFRIYNMHLYLTEQARLPAVRRILERVGSGDPSDAILIAGDFNATPEAPSRRLFEDAGLVSAAGLAGEPAGRPTYQFYGIPLRSLDGLYLGTGWRVLGYRVVDVKPGNTFPSDHFGVLADLGL